MNQIMQHDDFGAGGPVAGQYYLAKSLGAPFKVYLASGVKINSNPLTGKLVTEITDLPGLIAAVVRSRVLHPRKLSGEELRFIRSALCLRSKTVAAAIDLTPEHYSRCEAGRAMSATTEKVYRSYAYLMTFVRDRNVRDTLRQQKEKIAISAEDARNALAAFQKLFLEMKISPVFNAEEELEFTFWRRCPDETTPCGDDDAEWKSEEVDQIAA